MSSSGLSVCVAVYGWFCCGLLWCVGGVSDLLVVLVVVGVGGCWLLWWVCVTVWRDYV